MIVPAHYHWQLECPARACLGTHGRGRGRLCTQPIQLQVQCAQRSGCQWQSPRRKGPHNTGSCDDFTFLNYSVFILIIIITAQGFKLGSASGHYCHSNAWGGVFTARPCICIGCVPARHPTGHCTRCLDPQRFSSSRKWCLGLNAGQSSRRRPLRLLEQHCRRARGVCSRRRQGYHICFSVIRSSHYPERLSCISEAYFLCTCRSRWMDGASQRTRTL